MRQLRLGRRVALLVPLALLFGVVCTTGRSEASAPVPNPATFTSDAVTFTSTYSYFPALARGVVGSPAPVAVDEAIFKMAPGEIRRVTDQLEIRGEQYGKRPGGGQYPRMLRSVRARDLPLAATPFPRP